MGRRELTTWVVFVGVSAVWRPRGPASPVSGARGSGSACEVTGMIVTVRVRLRAAGGCKKTVSARAAEVLRGLRGLEASFMSK